MTVITARHGHLNYVDSDLYTPSEWTAVPIFDWRMSYSTNVEKMYIGPNRNHSLAYAGRLSGQVSFSMPGCSPGKMLIKPKDGWLKARLYREEEFFYDCYLSPRKFVFNWDYSGAKVSQYTTVELDIVWYEPEWTPTDEDTALIQAETCPLYSACDLLYTAKSPVTKVALTFNCGDFPHFFTYNPDPTRALVARQPNPGLYDVSLVATLQDNIQDLLVGGYEQILISVNATQKWEIKWMMLDSIDDLVVSRATQNIISAKANYVYSINRPSPVYTLGHILLPTGESI